MEPDAVESGQGGAGLDAALELLLSEGPYLRGDPAGKGQRQIAAIQRLTAALPQLCAAFRAMIRAGDGAQLTVLAPLLWSCLELAAEYHLLLELGEELLAAEGDGDPLLRSCALYALGCAQRRLSSNSVAEQLLHDAERLAAELGQPLLECRIRRALAQCLAHEDSDKARLMLEQALETAQAAGDDCEQALVLNQLGILDFELGDYEQARANLGRAAQMLRRIGHPEGESRSLVNLGLIDLRDGKPQQARELLERALAQKEQLHDRRGTAVCLANLGSVASDTRDYAAARSCYQRALDIAKETGDRALQGILLTNLGMLAREEQDYVLAATLLSVALEFHRGTGNRLHQAVVLRFMAIISMLQGNVAEAVQYLGDSLELYRKLGAERELAVSAGLAGVLLARQGDLGRGAALVQAALMHEQQRNFGFETDVRELLDNCLYEVAQTHSSAELRSSGSGHLSLDLGGMDIRTLSDFALRTLRERFGYSLTTGR